MQILDFLIGYGVCEIISIGSCGTLEDFPENKLLIPIEALRDEGTSYHYLPSERTITLNKTAINAIAASLSKKFIQFELCKTWTTDGFYRETPAKIKKRKEEGCITVEMEASAYMAVAQFLGITFSQILYAGDNLGGEEWDSRDFIGQPEIRKRVIQLSFAI